MPQFLAIEWDAAECRVAVAALRGRQFLVEQAFSFARSQGDDSPEVLGAQLAKELDARSCGRPDTLVSVGRTRIELRLLTVPPAEQNDLPDLVRFQAAREFNELDDQWRLDFLPIQTEGESKTVLATAISPAEIAAIEKVCARAGLTLRRVLLRPCEAAPLLTAGSGGKSPQLLIELFAEEADLTVVDGGTTVFLRTTRFAGGRPAVPALVAEIRLTLAAARNQLGGGKIDSVVLCGKNDDDVTLAESVKAELGVPVTLLDPFAGVATSPALARAMPANAERFAPLLGMLHLEARGAGHPIDFINPRRRPEPVSRRNLWISLAATAAVLVLAYIVWGHVSHLMLAAEVDGMTAHVKSMEEKLKKETPTRLKAADIRKWTDQDRNWLDKLQGLARGLPPAQRVRLLELSARTDARSSEIDIKGLTSTYETIAEMEEGVRRTVGKMSIRESRQGPSPSSQYPWEIDATIQVEKTSSSETTKPASSETTKPASSETTKPAGSETTKPASSGAASVATDGDRQGKPTATASSRGSASSSGSAPSSSLDSATKPSATGARS